MSEDLDMAVANTDRELWRESPDFYADSIHVTEQGGIGISVGGHVIVHSLTQWHAMANEVERLRAENAELRCLSPNGPRQPDSERSNCRPDERDMM